jgi:ketosteroid isomerase-like protein
MTRRFAAIAFAFLTLSSATGTAQTGDAGIDAAMRQFLTAFNNLDLPAFLDCFAADATVFHPPSAPPRTFPTRIQGRQEIQQTFEVVFAQIRTRSGRTAPPFQDLQPQDLEVQRLDDVAVVTFHLGTATARSRRTLVLHRAGTDWRIVHLHASTFNAP